MEVVLGSGLSLLKFGLASENVARVNNQESGPLNNVLPTKFGILPENYLYLLKISVMIFCATGFPDAKNR